MNIMMMMMMMMTTDDDGNLLFDNNEPPQPVMIFVADPAFSVSPTMSANGARVSFFMEKMTETDLDVDAGQRLAASRALPEYVNHANMLSPAELRLIAEYLDIGGQYFNNPFDENAPQND